MKLKLLFEQKNIYLTITKDLPVKELIKSLKSSIIDNFENQEILIIDENQIILSNSDIIKFIQEDSKNKKNEISIDITINEKQKSTKEKILFIHTFKKSNPKKYKNFDEFFDHKNYTSKTNLIELEDLIMKTTNAKEKLNVSKNLKIKPSTDKFRIFEDLLNSNLNNIIESRVQSNKLNNSGTRINELLEILRPIMDSDFSDPIFNMNVNNSNVSNEGHPRIHLPRGIQPVVNPDENMLNSLKEMGFPEDQCRRALVVSRNNVSRATDLLLSDGLDLIPQNINNNVNKYF